MHAATRLPARLEGILKFAFLNSMKSDGARCHADVQMKGRIPVDFILSQNRLFLISSMNQIGYTVTSAQLGRKK
jgi:hypothetical protein